MLPTIILAERKAKSLDVKIVVPILLSLALSSCTSQITQIKKLPAIKTADEVLDEWGSVTASPPIISIPADEYEFKIEKTPQGYYTSARTEINAGIAQHTKTIFSFLLAASAQADATTKAIYENQLETYQNAVEKSKSLDGLTDEEKLAAQKAKQQIIDDLAKAAKENYEKCVDIADNEGELVSGAINVSDAVTLNNAAVNRRKECLDNYQEELTELATVSELPDFPELPNNNVPNLERMQSTPFAAGASINADNYSLDDSEFSKSFSLPDYNALPQAATNKFLADMLTTISTNEDENAYFGVSMISVNPGWRTREGYHAVVNLHTSVKFIEASKSTIEKYIKNTNTDENLRKLIKANYFDSCSTSSPTEVFNKTFSLVKNRRDECQAEYLALVQGINTTSIPSNENLLTASYSINTTAISPVTYAQTQELQNRQISQINLSLMLAATLQKAGMKESAEAFADFSKQRKKEFGSRNADNNVGVFSTGDMVGLEIQPELFAATWDDADPSMILQQQTFPILLRFDTINERQFDELQVASECDDDPITTDFCLLEPTIAVSTSTSWKSSERSAWLFNYKKQLTTEDQYNLYRSLQVECSSQSNVPFLVQKCKELETKLFGNTRNSRLPNRLVEKPVPPPVTITHIFPSSLELERDVNNKPIPVTQDYVLVGENYSSFSEISQTNLKDKFTTVYGGIEILGVEINGNVMTINTKVNDANGPVIFIIEDGKNTISSAMSASAISELKLKAPSEVTTNGS